MSAPYWDFLKQHQLRVQKCSNCGTLRHYPRPLCDKCYSFDYAWQEISRKGAVHSWAVSHHAFHPGFKREAPYLTVTVDMDDGVRMHAPLQGPPDTPLQIGTRVTLEFDDIDGELTVPCFRLDDQS